MGTPAAVGRYTNKSTGKVATGVVRRKEDSYLIYWTKDGLKYT